MKRMVVARRFRTALTRLLVFLALAAGLAQAAAPEAAPRIVATIAPVHSLVAAIMEDVAEPHLLLPGGASPHDFALRPSDARALAGADLVVWVGESLETFLPGVLETSGAPALELMDAPGVDPVPYEGEPNEAGHDEHAHEGADPDKDGNEHHEDDHDHTGLDPHVWLDPVRAQAIAKAVAGRLAEIDPENTERYRTNAERLSAKLAELDEELDAALAPYRDMPLLTFHDGYSYFTRRYDLNLAGIFTLDPQRRPGARSVARLQEMGREAGIVCAFAEPQFDDHMVRRLADETGVRLGVLDPYGAGLEPGPELYVQMMRANAEAVRTCLGGAKRSGRQRN